MNEQCRTCDAKCCRYFCFEIDKPETYEEFDDIGWFLLHEGITVHIDEGDWYISIANRCKALDENNQCRIYEDRPLICRNYDMDSCDYTQGDYGYDALFETPEDLDRYARTALGGAAYERAKAQARAKAARRHQIKERKAKVHRKASRRTFA